MLDSRGLLQTLSDGYVLSIMLRWHWSSCVSQLSVVSNIGWTSDWFRLQFDLRRNKKVVNYKVDIGLVQVTSVSSSLVHTGTSSVLLMARVSSNFNTSMYCSSLTLNSWKLGFGNCANSDVVRLCTWNRHLELQMVLARWKHQVEALTSVECPEETEWKSNVQSVLGSDCIGKCGVHRLPPANSSISHALHYLSHPLQTCSALCLATLSDIPFLQFLYAERVWRPRKRAKE